MKNTIRCCISCILPCGALDVVRIVHANGRVEEISGSVTAEEIMRAHPKHVLKKPSSSSSSSSSGDQDHDHQGLCPKIVVVPPDAELQRGKIYFLMPLPHNSSEKMSSQNTKKKSKTSSTATAAAAATKPRSSSIPSSNHSSSTRRKKRELAGSDHHHHHHHHRSNTGRNNVINNGNGISVDNFLVSDRYLSEILSEKVSTQRDRRRGRAGVWRPHLESITESTTATPGDQAC